MGLTGDGYLGALLTHVNQAELLELLGPLLAQAVTAADETGSAQATVRLDGRLQSVRLTPGSGDAGRACVDAVAAARRLAGRSLAEQMRSVDGLPSAPTDDEVRKLEAEVRRIAREIGVQHFEGGAAGVQASVTGLGVLVDLTISERDGPGLGDDVVEAVHAAEAAARQAMRDRIGVLPLGGRTVADFLP